MLKLNFVGVLSDIAPCLSELSAMLDFCVDTHGITVNVEKCDGVRVEINEGKYLIAYKTVPDFCRGLCILSESIKRGEAKLYLHEKRKMNSCGIMIDLSRNAVLRVETLKDMIRRMAKMGMNSLLLYMEDTYRIDGYPYFGYMRGAYTNDELKAVDQYAELFGIEVVACIQTLGHLQKALYWPDANGIRDTESVLLIDEPKTYDFIEAMVSSVSKSLHSRKIHIGMDEAWGLATGEYQRLHGEADKLEIFMRHLKRVMEIVSKYGMHATMWSDMIFRYSSKSGVYYDPAVEMSERVLKAIPKDITLAYWDYYHEDAAFYEAMLQNHMALNRNTAFYGGVWTWNGVAVNYDKTMRTTHPAMEACKKLGITEVYATLWGDDGAETDVHSALLGMQLYAEYIYTDQVIDERLREMFRICSGYDAEAFLLLDIDNIPGTEHYKDTSSTEANVVMASKQLLYQDVLEGLMDKTFEKFDLKGHYSRILSKLDQEEIPEDLKELFEYHKQLVVVLEAKCDLGMRITRNYAEKDESALQKNVEELQKLCKEVELLADKRAALWLKYNKAFGLDRIDMRFGGLIMRFKRAEQRLKLYLENKIPQIEELEEKRLPFSTSELVHCQYADRYNTVSV